MELSTTIMGLAILALFIVPVVLISRSSAKKRSDLLAWLNNESRLNGLALSEADYLNESAIGNDTQKKVIVHVDESTGERVFRMINMRNIRSVNLNDKSAGSNNNGANGRLNRPGLIFVSRDGSKPDIQIPFSSPGSSVLSKHDSQLLEKWLELAGGIAGKADN